MASLMGMGLAGQLLGKGDGAMPMGLLPALLNRKKKAAPSAGAPASSAQGTILTNAMDKRASGGA